MTCSPSSARLAPRFGALAVDYFSPPNSAKDPGFVSLRMETTNDDRIGLKNGLKSDVLIMTNHQNKDTVAPYVAAIVNGQPGLFPLTVEEALPVLDKVLRNEFETADRPAFRSAVNQLASEHDCYNPTRAILEIAGFLKSFFRGEAPAPAEKV